MEMIKTQDLAFTYPGTEDQVNTRALRGVASDLQSPG